MAESDVRGFLESQARIETAVADGKKIERPKYHWFEGKEWLDVFYCLAKHGFDRSRIEVHDGLKTDGLTPDLWVIVKDVESGKVLGAFNVSHPCPPDCGGDKA